MVVNFIAGLTQPPATGSASSSGCEASQLLVKIARGDCTTPEAKSAEKALQSLGPGWKDGSPAWRLLERCWSKVSLLSRGAWAKRLGPRTFTYLTSWEGVSDFDADPPDPGNSPKHRPV